MNGPKPSGRAHLGAMPCGEEALRSPFCPCCSEESYTVMNYAMLDQISVEKVETTEPPSPPPGRPGGHLLRVAMERDSEGRREEVLLSAETL